MKIISATYGCSHCDFKTTNLKEMEKHEIECVFNPQNTEAKSILLTQMKESKSLKELNGLLINLLNIIDLPLDLYYRFQDNDKEFQFDLKNYKLHIYELEEITKLGIPVDISEYPHLNDLVSEMRHLNKISEEFNKTFKQYKNNLLEQKIKDNNDLTIIENKMEALLKDISKLTLERNQYKNEYQKIKNTINEEIIKSYDKVNPKIRLNEIRESLNIF